MRRPDLYRQARKAGAGADVDDAGIALGFDGRDARPYIETLNWTGGDARRYIEKKGGKKMAGGEQGFAEVASDDFFRLADGGEVDAGIPAD